MAVDAAGDRVDLPEGLSRLLRRASEEVAAGHNVTMLRSDEVLTPNEAAEVLTLLRDDAARNYDHYAAMLNEDSDGKPVDPSRQGCLRR